MVASKNNYEWGAYIPVLGHFLHCLLGANFTFVKSVPEESVCPCCRGVYLFPQSLSGRFNLLTLSASLQRFAGVLKNLPVNYGPTLQGKRADLCLDCQEGAYLEGRRQGISYRPLVPLCLPRPS